MMEMKWIAIIVLCVQGFVTIDGNAKELGLWTLQNMLHFLNQDFPKISQTDGLTSTQFLFVKLSKPEFKEPEDIIPSANAIQYKYGKQAICFDLDHYWDTTFLILSFMGKGSARVCLNLLSLKIYFKNNDFNLELQYDSGSIINIQKYNVTKNTFAGLLGMESRLREVLRSQWISAIYSHIQTNFIPVMKSNYALRFPPEHTFFIVHNRNTQKFVYTAKRMKIAVTDEAEVECFYSKNSARSIARESKADFLFEFIDFTTIFNGIFNSFTMLLNNTFIKGDTLFRFNSEQLAIAIPDFYIEEGKVNFSVSLNSVTPWAIEYHKESKNSLRFKGPIFLAVFMYQNQAILQMKFVLGGLFEPVVSFRAKDNSAMFNLNPKSFEVSITSASAFKYKLMLSGLKQYVESGLNNWISRIFTNKILGNGMYLSVNHIIEKAKASVESEGIAISLSGK